MKLIHLEFAYRRYLSEYEKKPGDLNLAYQTKHALLVGFFCTQRRTKNMGILKAIRLLRCPPNKIWERFPNPYKEKLKELYRTVGTALAWSYRAKGVDELLADVRRFSIALKAGIEAEIACEQSKKQVLP